VLQDTSLSRFITNDVQSSGALSFLDAIAWSPNSLSHSHVYCTICLRARSSPGASAGSSPTTLPPSCK
jgi:hypothetical protein